MHTNCSRIYTLSRVLLQREKEMGGSTINIY